MMAFKILGTIFVLAGLFLIARFDQHLVGLLFMLVGFYLAMKKGMKPR
jgi:hypothetical protein